MVSAPGKAIVFGEHGQCMPSPRVLQLSLSDRIFMSLPSPNVMGVGCDDHFVAFNLSVLLTTF